MIDKELLKLNTWLLLFVVHYMNLSFFFWNANPYSLFNQLLLVVLFFIFIRHVTIGLLRLIIIEYHKIKYIIRGNTNDR